MMGELYDKHEKALMQAAKALPKGTWVTNEDGRHVRLETYRDGQLLDEPRMMCHLRRQLVGIEPREYDGHQGYPCEWPYVNVHVSPDAPEDWPAALEDGLALLDRLCAEEFPGYRTLETEKQFLDTSTRDV